MDNHLPFGYEHRQKVCNKVERAAMHAASRADKHSQRSHDMMEGNAGPAWRFENLAPFARLGVPRERPLTHTATARLPIRITTLRGTERERPTPLLCEHDTLRHENPRHKQTIARPQQAPQTEEKGTFHILNGLRRIWSRNMCCGLRATGST
jgi:hypothetical protein